jgi:hypothetical protein
MPTTTPPSSSSDGDCGITNPSACIGEGIAGFVNMLVGESLNMLLRWVGSSLLTTPTLDSLPRLGELWEQSRLFVVAAYSILVMIAGIVVMGHESVQVRYSIREMGPRLVVGFLAANLSLFVGDQAIRFANAASIAMLGDGLDPQASGQAITEMFIAIVANSLVTGGLFAGFLSLVLTILLVTLLIGYIVRVALTVILLAGAPLALMCHGLPQTEGIAFWFWRAGGGVLGIQIGQSLALICALRVFLQPGGFRFFGPTADGLVNLIVVIALVWILVKIPSWVLRLVQFGGGGRSFVGGVARAFVFGKAMGLLGGRAGMSAGTAAGRSRSTARSLPSTPAGPAPIREWGGLGGIYTPEAIGRRLREQRAREMVQRRPRSGYQFAPRFLQPSPQVPTHDLSAGKAPGRPAMPVFRSTAPDNPSTGSTTVRYPLGSSGAPVFHAPGQPRRAPVPPPRARTAAVPPQLQFQSATLEPPVRPVRADGPPPAAVFQQAIADAGRTRRTRTHTPAPVLFHAPPPATTSTSSPRTRPAHAPRPGGD